MGRQHDNDFPVAATTHGIQIHRPEGLIDLDDPDSVASAEPTTRPSRRNHTTGNEILKDILEKMERAEETKTSIYVKAFFLTCDLHSC